jgi:hypothetical protein
MRIAFLLAAMLLLGAQADGGLKPEVTGTIFMVDVNGSVGVGFQFDVKDADALEENKKLAVALLPDAIKVAEARKAQSIIIRAIGPKSGPRNTYKAYGYVWKKDPKTDAWVEYRATP